MIIKIFKKLIIQVIKVCRFFLDYFYLITIPPIKPFLSKNNSFLLISLVNKSYIGWRYLHRDTIKSHQNLETYRTNYDMSGLELYDKYISRERWLYNKKILDLGCFVGGKAQLFAENGAREVIGIDLSERGIKVAKKYEKDNLKYYRISSTELKKDYREYFDSIVSFTVFEHIQTVLLPTVIEDCYELLNKNGKCIITYNFFYDRYGTHTNPYIYHPFPQFLFNEKYYLEYCDKKLRELHRKGLYGYFPEGYSYKRSHNNDCYMALNKLTSLKFKKLLERSKFKKIEDYKYSRNKQTRILSDIFQRNKFFECSHVYILYKGENDNACSFTK